MMSARQWLSDFFSARSLNKVSGAPLYSYKLSSQEYLLLQQVLRQKTIGALLTVRSDDWGSVLVLYASEWWRREFNGGPWSWSPIFQSLGLDEQQVSVQQRSELVAVGLKYWQRPLQRRSNGKDRLYLASIAVEGGLPLQLVTQSGSRLANYFEQVIKSLGQNLFNPQSSEQFARMHDNLIAKSFRRPEVHKVVGDIVEIIFELIDDHQLEQKAEAIAYLEAAEPGWRDKLPLNLEQAITKELIDRALGKAVETRRKLPDAIKAQRYISRVCDNPDDAEHWQLHRVLALKPRVSIAYLKQLFNDDFLPSRVSLFVVGDKAYFIGHGVVLNNSPEHYYFEVREPQLPAHWFAEDLHLELKANGGKRWTAPLNGGSALSYGSPWLFVEKQRRWLFFGAGNIETEHADVLVCCAPEKTIAGQVDCGQSNIPFERKWYTLEEPGEYRCDEHEIALGVETRVSPECLWQGETLVFKTNPGKCFVGVPRLFELSYTGQQRPVESTKLRWRKSQTGFDGKLEDMPWGKNILGYVDNYQLVRRFSVAVVPPDFAIELLPGAKPNSGRVRLKGGDLPEVSVVNIDRVHIELNEGTGFSELSFNIGDVTVPTKIELRLNWPGSNGAIEVSLPFPRQGVMLLNKDDKPVKNHTALCVGDLLGYELVAHDLCGAMTLAFELRANDLSPEFAKNAHFSVVINDVESFVHGVPLRRFREQIQQLFALTQDYDAKVKCNIANVPGAKPSLIFCTFNRNLKPLKQLNQIAVIGSSPVSCDVLALPVDRPGQSPLLLNNTGFNVWDMPIEQLSPGAWLIYCDDKGAGVRPCMWSHDLQKLTVHETEFERAAGLTQKSKRINAFASIAKQITYDLNRAEWVYVKHLLQFDKVPLNTFDLWRGAIKEPAFMLAMALKAGDKMADLIAKFDREFPFLWYSLGIDEAAKAVKAFKQDLTAKLDSSMSDTIDGIVKTQLLNLAECYPGFEVLNRYLLQQTECASLFTAIPLQDFFQDLYQLRNELSHRVGELRWPDKYAHSRFIQIRAQLNDDLAKCCLDKQRSFKTNVFDAPVLLALGTSTLSGLKIRFDAEMVHAMRQYRLFDEEYFDRAFALTQHLLLSLFYNKSQE